MNNIFKRFPLRTSYSAISINRNVCTTHISLQCSTSQSNTRERTIAINVQGPITNEASTPPTSNTTFSEEEVSKFRNLAGEWWKPDGMFKLLHSMNRLRVALVRDGLIETGTAEADYKEGPRPLEGVCILDVGCGGGILAEPLARLGASVTGLDAAAEGIEVAKVHAARDPKLSNNLNYICGKIEDHVTEVDQPYDAIVASEVLEHVSSIDVFLDACCAGLKPNGSLFVTTINRTPQSYLGAILAAEYLLRIVPCGTHDWNKFVPPQDLQKMLEQRGFRVQLQHGMIYFLPTNTWCWSRDSGINYALHAVKTS